MQKPLFEPKQAELCLNRFNDSARSRNCPSRSSSEKSGRALPPAPGAGLCFPAPCLAGIFLLYFSKNRNNTSLKYVCITPRLKTSYGNKEAGMFSKNLLAALLRLCDQRKWSYEKAAERCGISARHFGNLVRGTSVPSLKTLEKLCAGFGVTPNELLLKEHEHRM